MAINDGGRNNETSNHNGKRNGGGRLRKVANFSGDFPEGRDPCRSCNGYTVRKTKHNHAATAGINRKTARLTANGGRLDGLPKIKKYRGINDEKIRSKKDKNNGLYVV